MKVLFVYLKVL